MESCYIPNNPHFGLQVDAGLGGSGPPGGALLGTGGGGPATPGPVSTYWSPEDMGTFSLPALDLDPLPSLFPFSPCASSCKSEFAPLTEKKPHDMADVLLSLKHAVVHPGQAAAAAAAAAAGQLSPTAAFAAGAYGPLGGGGGGCIGGGGGATGMQGCSLSQPPSAYQGHALSYAVHPHQMMSPGGGYGSSQYCSTPGGPQDQATAAMFGAGNGGGGGGGGPVVQPAQHHNMFPSMSVNVSMNMTMHGYPTNMADNLQHQVTCPQMQWGPPPPNPSPVYPQAPQGLLSPQAYPGGTTYSFTADFRPPPVAPEPSPLLTANSSFKPVLGKVSFSPPLGSVAGPMTQPLRGGGGGGRPRPVPGVFPGGKMAAAAPVGTLATPVAACAATAMLGDDSQRPNLCRICGKTYARPSTLKTHLRTHSGEKPYRCGDCNKSFSQAANLTAHVRTHSGEKPFRCPICDRRFSQSSSVTTHMRTHSGERPYRCRLCKKAFSDSSTLTKHLRIHSGEKPYQCKLCLLRFSQSGNLNRHMRVHGGGGGGGGGTLGASALAGPA